MENWQNKQNKRPRNGEGSPTSQNAKPTPEELVSLVKREYKEIIGQEYKFQSAWITNGFDENFNDFANNVGKYLEKKELSSSKIRNIFNEIKRIQMNYEEEKSSSYLLRPKIAYAVGRDNKNYGLQMFKIVFDDCFRCVTEEKHYHNLCGVIEALIAYHKYYGGKD